MSRSGVRMAVLGAFALGVAALGAAAPAQAITVQNYQKYRLDAREMKATVKSLLEIRVEGVLQGLIIASRIAAASGGKALVCPPGGEHLRGAEVLKLLDDEIASGRTADGKPHSGDAAIEDLVLVVAQKRWPCSR